MINALAGKECKPCSGETPKLQGDELARLTAELGSGWRVVDEHHLEKDYKFKNFSEALSFTNKVGQLAESVNHHPDIFLAWGRLKLTLWTHSIGGLSESDFIFAAKVGDL